MLVIGLTGSFGTGKTTVGKMFSALGAKIVNADQIVHQLFESKGPCFQKVVRCFGKEILSMPDEKIDRKKLAAIIFSDPQRRLKLERIVHPYVVREIKKNIRLYKNQKTAKVLILDVPLLFESGLDRNVDVSIVVKTSQRNQINRVIQRGNLSQAQVLRRIRAQMPLKQKVLLSDMVIDNSGTISMTRDQVKKVWKNLIKKSLIGN